MDQREYDKNYDANEDSWRWILLILALMLEDERKKDEQWNAFEHDLIYKNRFSSNHPIVKELHKQSGRATKRIPANSVFYRARSFGSTGKDKLLEYYLKALGKTKAEIKEILSETSDYQKEMLLLTYNNQDLHYSGDPLLSQKIIEAQRKWMRYVRFKGYNASNSTAPGADLVSNGRANPDHIRYLYLCEDEATPIYEIHPFIGETVSVAKFKLLKDIQVYDLTLTIPAETSEPDIYFPSLYNSIGKMFSKPHSGDASKYIPTQYLAEEIKRMGFDGLRFNSSLRAGGVNLVLFDPDLCDAMSSDLVEVKSITINTDTPSFYKIGTADSPVSNERPVTLDSV